MSNSNFDSSRPDLSKILTTSLYTHVYHKLAFPWVPKPNGELPVKWIASFWFRGIPDPSREVYDALHHQALKPISLYCPSIPDDLTSFLPPPTNQTYPEHVLALLFILDQAPRRLYWQGTDVRWPYGYFDSLAKDVVQKLISRNAFPESTKTFEDLGYSFEEAMIRKMWLYTPLIHSEDIAHHDWMVSRTEGMRQEVETYSGRQDPFRATRGSDAKDPTMFSKLIKDGPLDSDFADFMFWFFRVFDVHGTVIRAFGRYPYRNTALGRVSTEEEEKFLDKTDGFGQAQLTEEEVRKLREQARTWEPLGDKGPF